MSSVASATATAPAPTATARMPPTRRRASRPTAGWTASGRLGRISGVSVANSATPGGAPTLHLPRRDPTSPITLEYQLCFKCHSGFTKLDSNVGFAPSRYVLDKAIEFNPNNASFHPIEAAGTNGTAAMAASLAGPSTFKQWNFQTTSTIRCENCHGDQRKSIGPAAPGPPPRRPAPTSRRTRTSRGPPPSRCPGSSCSPTSTVSLNGPTDAYAGQRLRPVLHVPRGGAVQGRRPVTRGPTRTSSTTASTSAASPARARPERTSTRPNNGGGLAICAECHFRIHSTTFATGGQGAYQRLVNFAPNVTASGSTSAPVGVDAWDQNARTCTLTCHGQDHGPKGY